MTTEPSATILSPIGPLLVRRAEPAELATVMDIMDEAAAWMEGRGARQWPSPHPPHARARIATSIEAGVVYLALTDDGSPAATLRMLWEDPYWPADDSAGYVHGMAVRNAVRGAGLGQALLTWAQAEAHARGRSALRLDCLATNGALCDYYERLGFRHCGTLQDQDYLAALFQREG